MTYWVVVGNEILRTDCKIISGLLYTDTGKIIQDKGINSCHGRIHHQLPNNTHMSNISHDQLFTAESCPVIQVFNNRVSHSLAIPAILNNS